MFLIQVELGLNKLIAKRIVRILNGRSEILGSVRFCNLEYKMTYIFYYISLLINYKINRLKM